MGRGATQQEITSGIRSNLAKFKKEIITAGGTATSSQILTAGLNGKQIKACYRIIRASNGETAGILCLNVDGMATESVFGSFESVVQEIIAGERG
jgi:predicted transcriptional regulator YheO